MVNIKPEQIIWSADVKLDGLREVVDSKALPEGTVIKLDRLFFEENDKSIITYCQENGYPVFVDAKIIEIPDKVVAIANTYLKYKPWMLNVMAGACSTGIIDSDNPKKIDALKRFAEACAEVETKSCAVTVLTSKSSDLCEKEFNSYANDQVLFYVNLMNDCGLTDIVCSAQEAEEIRNNPAFDKLSINTPGIRLPNSSTDDQQRIMTPAKAIQSGADRLVIGRNITEGDGDIAERIKRNYAHIIENIQAGYIA